jgi:hypothetical protein
MGSLFKRKAPGDYGHKKRYDVPDDHRRFLLTEFVNKSDEEKRKIKKELKSWRK